MPPTPWVDATHRDAELYETVGALLKGPEAILPNGITFKDRAGNQRSSVRLAWWKPTPTNWADAVDPSEDVKNLESIPWESDATFSYPAENNPVFFGHFWRSGTPNIDADNALCLDYSAGKGGHLTSYRFHVNHDDLHPDRMTQVDVKKA